MSNILTKIKAQGWLNNFLGYWNTGKHTDPFTD
uniref:Uncharacterized protein n=1 Tax=Trichinella nativa TaxID=6335 RepID=A0A0V1IXF5_9BILA